MRIDKYDSFNNIYYLTDTLVIRDDMAFEEFEDFVKTSLEMYLEYENAEYGVYITEKLWEYGESDDDLRYIFECMQNNDLWSLDRMFLEN